MFHLIVSKQYVYYIIFLGFVFRRLLSAGTDKQDMRTTCKASFLIGHIHYLIWLYVYASCKYNCSFCCGCCCCCICCLLIIKAIAVAKSETKFDLVVISRLCHIYNISRVFLSNWSDFGAFSLSLVRSLSIFLCFHLSWYFLHLPHISPTVFVVVVPLLLRFFVSLTCCSCCCCCGWLSTHFWQLLNHFSFLCRRLRHKFKQMHFTALSTNFSWPKTACSQCASANGSVCECVYAYLISVSVSVVKENHQPARQAQPVCHSLLALGFHSNHVLQLAAAAWKCFSKQPMASPLSLASFSLLPTASGWHLLTSLPPALFLLLPPLAGHYSWCSGRYELYCIACHYTDAVNIFHSIHKYAEHLSDTHPHTHTHSHCKCFLQFNFYFFFALLRSSQIPF